MKYKVGNTISCNFEKLLRERVFCANTYETQYDLKYLSSDFISHRNEAVLFRPFICNTINLTYVPILDIADKFCNVPPSCGVNGCS